MENKLGRFRGIAFTTALILEGCSSVTVPTLSSLPSPAQEIPSSVPSSSVLTDSADIIVNCQADNKDQGVRNYSLNQPERKPVSVITESGEVEVYSVGVDEKGQFLFTPITRAYSGIGRGIPGGIELIDENFRIRATTRINGNITELKLSIDCIDALPQTPIPQLPRI